MSRAAGGRCRQVAVIGPASQTARRRSTVGARRVPGVGAHRVGGGRRRIARAGTRTPWWFGRGDRAGLVSSTSAGKGGRHRTGEAVTARDTERKLVASNRKARHDYAVLKTYEAGLVLVGTEVKSLRAGRVSLVDAFAQEHDGELMLHGLHIAEYGFGSWTNHQPRRIRKLLLRRVEIDRILEKLREGGMTLVPLSMYFDNGWAKVELALARGKRSYDKRQALAERDANREIARELGRHLKGRTRRRD